MFIVDPEEIAVALDSVIDGRHDFDHRLGVWRRAALAHYNNRHGTKFTHLYEYATRCAPASRRSHTLGDVYCRLCGDRLYAQVKEPHQLVKKSVEAQRHLTICTLHVLSGMRQPAKPGYRTAPMESWWS